VSTSSSTWCRAARWSRWPRCWWGRYGSRTNADTSCWHRSDAASHAVWRRPTGPLWCCWPLWPSSSWSSFLLRFCSSSSSSRTHSKLTRSRDWSSDLLLEKISGTNTGHVRRKVQRMFLHAEYTCKSPASSRTRSQIPCFDRRINFYVRLFISLGQDVKKLSDANDDWSYFRSIVQNTFELDIRLLSVARRCVFIAGKKRKRSDYFDC